MSELTRRMGEFARTLIKEYGGAKVHMIKITSFDVYGYEDASATVIHTPMEPPIISTFIKPPIEISRNPEPSIGRIVLYGYDNGAGIKYLPAIVRNVRENKTVDLTFFGSSGPFERNGVSHSEGGGPRLWSWPLKQ